MEILTIAFILLLGIEIVFGSLLIGKPRKPRTAGEYIFVSILNGLLIWLLVASLI